VETEVAADPFRLEGVGEKTGLNVPVGVGEREPVAVGIRVLPVIGIISSCGFIARAKIDK